MKKKISSQKVNEIDRNEKSGKIVFDIDSKRYFFEGIPSREIKQITSEGFSLPLRVQWRITKKCNLRCKHCYLDDKNNLKDELNKEQLIIVAKKLVEAKIFEVLITGGEPTIKEGILEVIKLLGESCSITLFTNALDRQALERILPTIQKYKKTFSINVSLDGPKEIHESIRGQGTYDKTIKNIKFLVSKDIEVNTNTVLTTSFIPYLENFIKEIKPLGVNSMKFSKFYPLGEGEESSHLMPSPTEFKGILSKLLRIKKEVTNPRIVFDNNLCFLINHRKIPLETRKCSGGFSKMVIESNGDIYPCQLLPLEEFKMGNILSEEIKTIWDSKSRCSFLKDFFPEECIICKHNKYCSSGCKAASYSLHKTFKYKDPYCFYGKERSPL